MGCDYEGTLDSGGEGWLRETDKGSNSVFRLKTQETDRVRCHGDSMTLLVRKEFPFSGRGGGRVGGNQRSCLLDY